MIDNTKEYILCSAIRRKIPNKAKPYNGEENDICNIEIGYRHHDIYQRFNDRDLHPDYSECPLSILMKDQGFYTSRGRFVDRYEAMEIAYKAGQVDEETAIDKSTHNYKKLFSEDLY